MEAWIEMKGNGWGSGVTFGPYYNAQKAEDALAENGWERIRTAPGGDGEFELRGGRDGTLSARVVSMGKRFSPNQLPKKL